MKESHKSDTVPGRESFLTVSILSANQKYYGTCRVQRLFFRSLCDMLFLKRERMNYHGQSVGVYPFTFPGLETVFALVGAYVPQEKEKRSGGL